MVSASCMVCCAEGEAWRLGADDVLRAAAILVVADVRQWWRGAPVGWCAACLVEVDVENTLLLRQWMAWWSPERKLCTDLVGAGSGGAAASFPSLEALAVELHPYPCGRSWLSGRNPKLRVPGRATAAATS